jgi:hypothetical protein
MMEFDRHLPLSMPNVSPDHIQVCFQRIAADVFEVLADERQTLTRTRHFAISEVPVVKHH